MKTGAMQLYANKQKAEQDRLDRIYPNRYTTIHKVPCKHCPSMCGDTSEESEDIKRTMSKEDIASKTLFPCGWRPSKLCKGYCDEMGIGESFIKSTTTPSFP